VRWLPDIDADRARLRSTLTYAITPSLAAGLEWNPFGHDVRPLATWRVFDETEARPALILGTSSDRIGTETGNAFTGVFTKDLEALTGLPISPYAGLYYGTQDSEFDIVGGLMIRWAEKWSSYHMWDGRNFHQMLEHWFENGQTLGLVVAELDGEYSVGVSWTLNFSMPWENAGE
jgi:hypothetical protein